MTPTLRKIHRYTWFLLAILLPIGWLASIWVLPAGVWQTPIRSGQPEPLPRLMQSKQSGDFVINLRQDSIGASRQIEIFIKKPQTNPNTTVIVETEGQAWPLGLLGSRGVQRFALDSLTAQSPAFNLRLEDRIQHRILRTIAFKQ
ncbi:MAG: hypothetical protein ABIQ93_02390 [Saprospiraceae bacterium]